jgi:hypothetical protein
MCCSSWFLAEKRIAGSWILDNEDLDEEWGEPNS